VYTSICICVAPAHPVNSIPHTQTHQALYSKYKKLRQKLEYERGEEVTDEELAPMLKVSSFGQLFSWWDGTGPLIDLLTNQPPPISHMPKHKTQISVKRLRQHLTLCKPQRFFEEAVGGVSLQGDAMYFYEARARYMFVHTERPCVCVSLALRIN
jgi:hypothetical protein